MSSNEKGQSLMELIVTLTIAILVLGSLAFAIITSLRNAQFAKNSAQATKLAQEGLEKVRSTRDRDGLVTFTYGDPAVIVTNFSGLWGAVLSCGVGGNCYFVLNPTTNILDSRTLSDFETVGSFFKRQIQIEDETDGSVQKRVTVVVQWDDTAGKHESRLTTILRKIN